MYDKRHQSAGQSCCDTTILISAHVHAVCLLLKQEAQNLMQNMRSRFMCLLHIIYTGIINATKV